MSVISRKRGFVREYVKVDRILTQRIGTRESN